MSMMWRGASMLNGKMEESQNHLDWDSGEWEDSNDNWKITSIARNME